jgi:hypothetical protein
MIMIIIIIIIIIIITIVIILDNIILLIILFVYNITCYNKNLLFEDLSTIPYNSLDEIFDVDVIIDAIKKEV